jgi:hypothetical protein
MKVKPMLGDWEVPHIASICAAERRAFSELAVPGRHGSVYQDLAGGPVRVAIAGSLYGDEVRDEFLKQLRGKFKAGEPVTFVADIVTATDVKYVVIEELRFAESGAGPDQTDYFMVIRESPPPPPPPDPLGGLDAGLLDKAAGFLGAVTGALDAIKALGSLPQLKDPTPPLRGALDGVRSAVGGLGAATGKLGDLFGGG